MKKSNVKNMFLSFDRTQQEANKTSQRSNNQVNNYDEHRGQILDWLIRGPAVSQNLFK